jgi:hypothetical protein
VGGRLDLGMFESICIKGKDKIGRFSIGHVAQSLIYYQKVILLLHHDELLKLFQYCDPDLLKEYLEAGFVEIYIKENLIGVANYGDGTYAVNAFSVVGKDYDFILNQALLSYSGRKGFSRRKTNQLLNYVKPYKYKFDLEKGVHQQLADVDFCKKAIIETVKYYAPQNELTPNQFDFSITPVANEKFTINYTLDYEGLKQQSIWVDPSSIVLNITESLGDVMLASEFKSEISTGELYSKIIQQKFNHLMKEVSKSETEIETFSYYIFDQINFIEDVINKKEKSFEDLFEILNKASKFKGWLKDLDENHNLLREYNKALTEKTWMESTPAKAVRFYLFNGSAPIVNAILGSPTGDLLNLSLSAIDTFFIGFTNPQMEAKSVCGT